MKLLCDHTELIIELRIRLGAAERERDALLTDVRILRAAFDSLKDSFAKLAARQTAPAPRTVDYSRIPPELRGQVDWERLGVPPPPEK